MCWTSYWRLRLINDAEELSFCKEWSISLDMCGIAIIFVKNCCLSLSLSLSFVLFFSPVLPYLFKVLGHLICYWNLFSWDMRAQPAFHSFLLSFQFFVLLETHVRHIRTLTRRITWSIQVSSSARAFRYRRKLRVTDRHQRGILRGFSQPLCFVPCPACKTVLYLAHLLSIIMMVIMVLLSG